MKKQISAILKKLIQFFDKKTLLFLFLILFLFYRNDQKLTKIESEMKQLTEVTNQLVISDLEEMISDFEKLTIDEDAPETNKPKPLKEIIVQMGSLTKNIIELQNN